MPDSYIQKCRSGVLEYFKETPDHRYWDNVWSDYDFNKELQGGDEFVQSVLPGFNQLSDRILEGGCGACSFVAAMERMGYRSVGVDFAVRTLRAVKGVAPDLTLCAADLTNLPFEDSSFDAYWSIGIIEHFQEGYGSLMCECRRVLRLGGIAYISFPYMNFLRKCKALMRMYNQVVPEGAEFYQYALNHKEVQRIWESEGFGFCGKVYMFPYFSHPLLLKGALKWFADPWHHHSIMLIFRKNEES